MPALDGIRGIAILVVMVYHFVVRVPRTLMDDQSPLFRLCEVGWIGVELFFVLSGFLITGILLDTRNDRRYFSTFYMRRLLRIFPAYYALLLGMLVIAPLVLGARALESTVPADKQWWFWCYLSNWLFAWEGGFNATSGGYLWSLAIEEQFYLVWPLVIYALPFRKLTVLCIALCISIWIVRPILVFAGVSTTSIYTMTFTHADGLVLGSFLAVASRHWKGSTVQAVVTWAAVPAALGVILVVVSCGGSFVFYNSAVAAFGLTCVAILSAYVLYAAVARRPNALLTWLFENSLLRTCGKFSYALYLVHVPVAALLVKLLLTPSVIYQFGGAALLTYLAAAFVTCWCLAIFSWYTFESPILSLKSHFRYGQ